jgi:hypothetical protein
MTSAKSHTTASVAEPRSATSKPLVSIVYHSGSDHTAEMAGAVARGVMSSGGVTLAQHRIADEDFEGSRWLNLLVTCSVFAMQHGMFWVGVAEGSSLGIFFGAAGRANHEPPTEMPSAEDKMTGEMLGRRVARLTARLHPSSRVRR